MKDTISIIIPAYNECVLIGQTIKAARSIPGVVQVIVVDDGSSDGTGELAKAAGGEVYFFPKNRGKGQALNFGITKAIGEITLFLDADLGESAVLAEDLVTPLLVKEADMTIGCFPQLSGRRPGLGLTLGLAKFGTWALSGLKLKAPLSGQRAVLRNALPGMHPFLPGFGVEVGLNVRAVRGGLRIKEIPVAMRHQMTERTIEGFCHRAKQFYHILLAFVYLVLFN